jgi:hypothetical protein
MCHIPVPGIVSMQLHYLLGLERLGFEVYYAELHGAWVANPVDAKEDATTPRVLVGEVLEANGLRDRWICRADHVAAGFSYGRLSRTELARVCRKAVAVVNVTGGNVLDDDLLECPCRIYVETDPAIPQIRLERGDAKIERHLASHTHHFTFAENLGAPDCGLPPTTFAYSPTRQPIALDLWDGRSRAAGRSYTTVARWSDHSRSLAYRGETYGWTKDAELRRFIDLPARAGVALELALAALPPSDRAELERRGWAVVDALRAYPTIHHYRRYIEGSRGEFTVAKDMNVRLRSGWFSERSACYLAAARPVVTQDTGFGAVLPTGEGLFAFETMDDILAAFEAIESDYALHSSAAREIAETYFDDRRVLSNLLERSGIELPTAVAVRA